MKRILFAALVIAALQTNISAAGKHSHSDDEDGESCSSVKRQRKASAYHDDKDRLAEIACLEDKIQAAKIATLQAQIALAKKEADQAAQKIEEATGRSVFAYSVSFVGSMFDTVASSLSWFGRGSAVVPLAGVRVAGAPFVGLTNNKNMCYQNALMQVVHKCAPLRDALQRNFDVQRAAGVIMPGYVEEFFATQVALSGAVALYNPIAFCTAVQDGIMNFVGAPAFPVGRQRDASEFLQIFWDRLQGAGIVPRIPAGNDGFHGIVSRDRLECSSCHGVRFSHASDYSTTLSVVIPAGDGTYPMNDVLANHSVGGDGEVACGTCAVSKVHEKKICVFVDPAQQFMIIQIKRFSFDPLTSMGVKCPGGVTLPADGIVTMLGTDGAPCRFRVAAVVVHAGFSGNGHYWTVTPHGVYDDGVVTPDGGAIMNELLATGLHGKFGTGYLYFFERV